jgi:Amt family ammonium transporter
VVHALDFLRLHSRSDQAPRAASAVGAHNIPYSILAGLLWVGWFGFNGGSARGNGLAVNAVVVTNTAAAAGTV